MGYCTWADINEANRTYHAMWSELGLDAEEA